MKSNKVMIKKSFEENYEDEICNFNSFTTENSELAKHNNTKDLKSRNSSKDKSEGNKTNKKKKKSVASRVSTRESHSLNLSTNNSILLQNNSVHELIESLKEKINIYEGEIRSLLDEKIQMQLTINNLQLSNYNNLKKSSGRGKDKSVSSSNQNSMIKSTESPLELNKYYIQEASGLKRELNNLESNIQRQKMLLEQNYSILDETIDITNSNSNNNHTPNNITAIYEGTKGSNKHLSKDSVIPNINEIANVN
jgi:hypothetical protein